MGDPVHNSFQNYLFDKNGTGIGKYATDAGTHKVGDTILNTYSEQGLAVPEDVANAIQEMHSIAAAESKLSGTTAGERRVLAQTGQWNPAATSKRHAELLGFVQERTRNVQNAEGRIAFRKKEIALAEAEANHKQRNELRPIQLQSAQYGLESTRLALEEARRGSMAAQRTAEMEAIASEGFANAGHIPTSDMLEVVQSRNPAMISEMFGENVTPDIALSIVRKRLESEEPLNTAIEQAELEAEVRHVDKLAGEYKLQDVTDMLSGAIPIPEGVSETHLLSARDELVRRETAATTLETVAMNADLQNANVRSELIGLKLQTMSIEDLETLYNMAEADPDAPFEIAGLDIEVNGREVMGALAPVMAEVTKRQAAASANQALQVIIGGAIDETHKVLADVQAQVGYIPSNVSMAVRHGQAKVNAALAAGNMKKAAAEGEKLMGIVRDSLEASQMPDDVIEAVLTGKNATGDRYSQGLADFFTSAGATSNLSQFGQMVAGQLTAIAGAEVNPDARSAFADKLHALTKASGKNKLRMAEEAFDEIGLTIKQFETTVEQTYLMTKLNSAAQLMAMPDFMGESVPEEVGQFVSTTIAQAVADARESNTPLRMSDMVEMLRTLGYNEGLGAELNNKFQQALEQTDISSMMAVPKGGTSNAEGAMYNFYAEILGYSQGFGVDSISLQDTPMAVNSMLDRQVTNQVAGLHNQGQPAGISQTNYLMANLTNDGRYIGGGTFGVGIGGGLTPYSHEHYQTTNPELTKAVAKFVAEKQLARSRRDTTWVETIIGYGGAPGTEAYGPTKAETEEHLIGLGLLERKE